LKGFFDSGPLPDWKEIQRWLGSDIPWNLVEQWENTNDNGWMDSYIKELLHKAKPQARTQSKSMAVTETTKDAKQVTVTITLPPDASMQAIRLYATNDRLKVAGMPGDRTQSIRLPCLVYPKSGIASMNRDRLRVRFRRRPKDQGEVELFIRS